MKHIGRSTVFLKVTFYCCLFFVAGFIVLYAEEPPRVYFKAASESVALGSEFTVKVLVDSAEPLNAFNVEIIYSPETLELVSLYTASSIIDLWRIRPTVSQEGILAIEGGALIPFFGRGGTIVEMDFRAKESGAAQLSFRAARLYYADGKGTRAGTQSASLAITVTEEGELLALNREEDRTPPLFLEAKIVVNPIDETQLVVFRAADRETGVQETRLRSRVWFLWSEWRPVLNPASLDRGVWSVQLRSIDYHGNTVTETLYVTREISVKLAYIVLFTIFIVGIVQFKLLPLNGIIKNK